MAWWTGETSSRVVRDGSGRIKSVFDYDEQFALFSSEEFKEQAKHADGLAKLLAGLPESVRKPLIVAACKAIGATYEDPTFPAALSSLVRDEDNLEDEDLKLEMQGMTWKRIEELYPGEKKVFDNIEPNDIHQGRLGDCYFLSALSALAETPSRIQRLFETAEYDTTGCYKLKMFEMGQPLEIVIDDFLPVNSYGELAFSGPRQEKGITELWVVLLEKAWAKRFGSYARIDAGFTNEALTDLTGAPGEILNQPFNIATWKKILEADQKDYVITAGSKASEAVKKQGLVAGHAYAVIAAKEVTTKTGKEQLLMIRNPWGWGDGKTQGEEWKGDWSDDSALWTPELKKELGWEKANDGRFWMNFRDFSKNYEEVVICHVHNDYNLANSLILNQPSGSFNVVQITLHSPGHFYATVNQKDAKWFVGQEYDPSPVRMVVARLGIDQELEFLKGRVQNIRDCWLDIEGLAGDYLFFFQVDWATPITTKVGFSVYTAQSVGLAEVTSRYQNFLQLVYNKQLAQSVPNVPSYKEARDVFRYSVKRFGEDGNGNLMEGFLTDVYENKGLNQRADITGMHPKFENLELLPPFSGREYKISVHSKEIVSVVKRVLAPDEEVEHQVKPAVKLQKT